MTTLNPNVDPLPPSMAHLPIDPARAMPVPWFVAWVGGRPEFRMAQGGKIATAVNQNRCWTCGRRHEPGRVTYLVGPMCGVNRVSAEPPSHLTCARYSVKNCPFLAKPQMVRRDHEVVAARGSCAGFMIERNPGVTLLWAAEKIRPVTDGRGGVLFDLGEPLALEFWSQGRAASREEVLRSVGTGLPLLQAQCRGPADRAALGEMEARFLALIPRPELVR